jgi:hypothetical protein
VIANRFAARPPADTKLTASPLYQRQLLAQGGHRHVMRLTGSLPEVLRTIRSRSVPSCSAAELDPHETSACALRRPCIRGTFTQRQRRRYVVAGTLIQVGPPFAEHLHTLPRVLVADTDPIHF